MAKKSGGARSGAGRKLAGKDRRTNEALKRAQETGETPADILLRLARDAVTEFDRVSAINDKLSAEIILRVEKLGLEASEEDRKRLRDLSDDRTAARKEARACAEAAAPYFNPRLASVDLGQSGPIRVVVESLPPQEKPPGK